ncbi:MAG TPA: FadR/GntR family transcriptional regulator [Spirochaetales bacterium]|nr:FadR/GntR family transcriptional regulator [Spirochaetales bacterium]HPG85167.1 FadR/GntR family transcriptional regulator [Spirochaetales bacterium]HPM72796.1 FadR/GntR family transcriptional regulator [Spirochaetales bacterium]HQO65836.1 FadR/GntR family transcriptional regulator [Spirochaetales bacterium]
MITYGEGFGPITPRSLKDEFIERFEALILSGKFAPGDKVPSERDLGVLFGISRPVVHEGLRALESRGLVTIESRKGARVNDYRREGSIEMLLSILNYTGGKLSQSLLDGILELRLLFEVETSRLAALRRSASHVDELRSIVARERSMVESDADGRAASSRVASPRAASAREVADIDLELHISIAIASGNEIYPLLMNSFRRIYLAILEEFYADASVVGPVFEYHERLVEAIAASDEDGARGVMLEMLGYSERNLRRILFG